MKYQKILFVILIVSGINLFAQTGSINNTLGTGGSFIVKDGTESFLRVDQLTGNAIILKNLELGGIATSNSTIGVITKNGMPFLNNYGIENTFLGINSGNFNMTGSKNTAIGFESLKSNIEGSENTAIGFSSLNSNTTGSFNTAVGNLSLSNNTTGLANTACGIGSLTSNTEGGGNCAFGNVSLYSNTIGNFNSAFGNESLRFNLGGGNSAFGSYSLYLNNVGQLNSAFGNQAMYYNTSGYNNSAFGYNALYQCNGQNNTAIGSSTGTGITTGNNNICIGYGADVPSGTLNNQVRIGNTSISYAGIQVAWSITSDKRWKENIHPSDLGLNFISKLNPVLYTRINDENQKIEYGLIAQELEQVLKEEGVINSAMLTIDGEGRYELRYNDLLAPMIKAIQELKQQNEELVIFNKELAEQNESLRQEIGYIKLSISEQIEVQVKNILTKNLKSERENAEISLGN